jgi:DNA-binding MarR family transcriptional regulator
MVEYTYHNGTRAIRHFKNAYQARSFYVRQDKLGNNPKVLKELKMSTVESATPTTTDKPDDKPEVKKTVRKPRVKKDTVLKKTTTPSTTQKKATAKKAAAKKATPAKTKSAKTTKTKAAKTTKKKAPTTKVVSTNGELSLNQVKILQALLAAKSKELTRAELSKSTGVAKGFSRLLGQIETPVSDSLKAKGLVKDAQYEGSRHVVYSLTAAGKKLAAKLK